MKEAFFHDDQNQFGAWKERVFHATQSFPRTKIFKSCAKWYDLDPQLLAKYLISIMTISKPPRGLRKTAEKPIDAT